MITKMEVIDWWLFYDQRQIFILSKYSVLVTPFSMDCPLLIAPSFFSKYSVLVTGQKAAQCVLRCRIEVLYRWGDHAIIKKV
jgi:hypothetical protein